MKQITVLPVEEHLIVREGLRALWEAEGDIAVVGKAETGRPAVQLALERSTGSHTINTAFVERHNGIDRNRNARKTRKSHSFSKDWDIHNAATYCTMYSYNFCWPVRTLRIRRDEGRWHPRTPALSAGLTDHVWSLEEWLTFPAVRPR